MKKLKINEARDTAEGNFFVLGKSIPIPQRTATQYFAVDMNNLPEGSVVFNARHISAAHIGRGGYNSTDFSQAGVIQRSLPLFNANGGLPLTRDHEERYNNTHAVIGKVGTGRYSYSRTNADGTLTPAGIDAPIIINEQDFGSIVNLIRTTALTGLSVTVRFKFKLSHELDGTNELQDFDDFLDKVGTIAPDGREYCYVATEILEYKASSLVLYQADPNAVISFGFDDKPLILENFEKDVVGLSEDIEFACNLETSYQETIIGFTNKLEANYQKSLEVANSQLAELSENLSQKNLELAVAKSTVQSLTTELQKSVSDTEGLTTELAVLQNYKDNYQRDFENKKSKLLAFANQKTHFKELIESATTTESLEKIAKALNTEIIEDFGYSCPQCKSTNIILGQVLDTEATSENRPQTNLNSL